MGTDAHVTAFGPLVPALFLHCVVPDGNRSGRSSLSVVLSYAYGEVGMQCVSVKRDQFALSPFGIVHKPTDAAFTPDPGDPYSGIMRLGNLRNSQPNGSGYKPGDVRRCVLPATPNFLANARRAPRRRGRAATGRRGVQGVHHRIQLIAL